MPSFLVEAYLAAPERGQLARVVRLARALEAGKEIRHVGSLVLLEDEICFHIFEAPSAPSLVDAIERAELEHDRVVETVWIPSYSVEAMEPI